MDAAFGGHHGVQLIDDHVFDFANDGLETRRSDGDCKALGCRDENVRGVSQHLLPVGLRRVPGAQSNTDFLRSVWKIMFGNFGKRTDEVSLNIVGQCLDW